MMGFEIADQLTKQAANVSPEGPEPFIGISQKMVCTNVCSWADKEHIIIISCGNQPQAVDKLKRLFMVHTNV